MSVNKVTENVTVGSADLFINGIDVGHLKDDVEFSYVRDKLPFKAANMLGDSAVFVIRETAEIRAKTAELKISNIKLALGVTTAVIASTSIPSWDSACSYVADVGASASWDMLTFGGAKGMDVLCVRAEHTRPNGKTFVVIFYKATSNTELLIPFKEEDFTLHDIIFRGLADPARAEGDQIGVMFDQVLGY